MIVIGIDPHKSTHTATAVDPATNTDLGSIRIDHPRWLQDTHRVGQGLVHAQVDGRERRGTQPSPGTVAAGPRRTRPRCSRRPPPPGSDNSPAAADASDDRIDAAAAACVVALQGDACPVAPEGLPIFSCYSTSVEQSCVTADLGIFPGGRRPDRAGDGVADNSRAPRLDGRAFEPIGDGRDD